MNINLILDAAAQAAPTAIKNDWIAAANILDNLITDNITVNIKVDFSGTGGGASAGPDNGLYENYSTVYNYLTSQASPGDTTFTDLPSTDPFAGSTQVAVWNAQLKAMGLIAANDTTTDDASSKFSTDISSSLMTGVALHEFGHALGRVPFSDGTNPDVFDLFRFTSPGTRLLSQSIPSAAAYFSLNNGTNKWADWGINSDPSDFFNDTLTTNDAFNEFYTGSTFQYLTPADIEELDTLGYHLNRLAPAADGHDFTGDNNADVLLQSGGGNIIYANMSGGNLQNWVELANTPGWMVCGAGKISGGLDSNVVIQNSGGLILYTNLVNGNFSNWVTVASAPGYNVVGVGDINRDLHADIVLQNHSNGSIVYANMTSGTFNNWVNVGAAPGWTACAVADVNGDGCADVVIQNNSSGAIAYANMANGTFSGWVGLPATPGWTVMGAGDINRDGFADIVIQNQSTGTILCANMAGGSFSGWVSVGSTPGWNVTAVEDIRGNGFDDIVVENSTSGALAYADMTTGTFQGWVGIGSAPGYVGHTNPGLAGSSVLAAVSVSDPGPGSAGALGPIMAWDPGTSSGSALGPVTAWDPGSWDASWLTNKNSPGQGGILDTESRPFSQASDFFNQAIAGFAPSAPTVGGGAAVTEMGTGSLASAADALSCVSGNNSLSVSGHNPASSQT
jgi:hypothetical protein